MTLEMVSSHSWLDNFPELVQGPGRHPSLLASMECCWEEDTNRRLGTPMACRGRRRNESCGETHRGEQAQGRVHRAQ